MSDLDILDKEFNSPSVFTDESKLSADFIPENLLFRETELKGLVRHFRGLFAPAGNNRGLILTGPIGSGKTSIAKKFGHWAYDKGSRDGLNIRYIHINCRRNKTHYLVLLQVARELNNHIPTRGYGADELMEIIIGMLSSKKIRLFLILDEVDFINNEELGDLLYSLSRSTDDQGIANFQITLLLISRTLNFVQKLDESTHSSLTTANMKLERYNQDQLKAIIKDRVRVSFAHGVVSPESIDLAAEIAGQKGDARQAIELVWYGGKIADKQNEEYVYPEHIREAKSNVDPSLLRQVVDNLSLHKMLLLLGIARRLRTTKSAHITTGEAKESYKMICEEFNETSRKHTQIYEYLKEFEKLGIIVLELSGEGIRGTTQLISIHDATAMELENAVLKRIDSSKTL